MVTKRIPASEQSTVKVRIIDFEMSGSDQSLQESLQTIAAAFSGGNQRVQVSRALPARSPLQAEKSRVSDLDEVTEEGDEPDANDQMQDVQPRTPFTAARKPPKPPIVRVLPDIVFTDTKPTLKEFFESKKPNSDLKRYIVVAYWYKHFRKIEDLTADHFHTAFRALGVPTPKNALQPLRDLRHSRNGKMRLGSTKGTYTIHHIGENAVDEMGASS